MENRNNKKFQNFGCKSANLKKKVIENMYCGRGPKNKMAFRIFMTPQANCR